MVSPSLKLEVRTYIFTKVISANDTFTDASANLIEFIVKRIDTKSYPPEEQLIKQGDAADYLYFLHSGECEVVV